MCCVYVSGENLLTITGLSDTMDPETAGIGKQGGTFIHCHAFTRLV